MHAGCVACGKASICSGTNGKYERRAVIPHGFFSRAYSNHIVFSYASCTSCDVRTHNAFSKGGECFNILFPLPSKVVGHLESLSRARRVTRIPWLSLLFQWFAALNGELIFRIYFPLETCLNTSIPMHTNNTHPSTDYSLFQLIKFSRLKGITIRNIRFFSIINHRVSYLIFWNDSPRIQKFLNYPFLKILNFVHSIT